MRSREEINQYEQRLEDTYLSRTEIMTDNDLHNLTVKINTATKLFKKGMTPYEIKQGVLNIMNVPISKFEVAHNRIQSELIKRGLIKGSKEFVKKEDELLLKWAKDGQLR